MHYLKDFRIFICLFALFVFSLFKPFLLTHSTEELLECFYDAARIAKNRFCRQSEYTEKHTAFQGYHTDSKRLLTKKMQISIPTVTPVNTVQRILFIGLLMR